MVNAPYSTSTGSVNKRVYKVAFGFGSTKGNVEGNGYWNEAIVQINLKHSNKTVWKSKWESWVERETHYNWFCYIIPQYRIVVAISECICLEYNVYVSREEIEYHKVT